MVVLSPAGARAQFTGVVTPPKKADAEVPAAVAAATADSVRETRLADMRAWVDSAATSLGVSTNAAADSTAMPVVPATPQTATNGTHETTSNGVIESMSSGVRAPDTGSTLPLLAVVGAVFISAGAFLLSTRPRRVGHEAASTSTT